MLIDPSNYMLKTALEQSPALTEEMRQKFLAAAEKGLTPEQVSSALAALKKAEEQYAAAKAAYDAKTKEINEKHLADLKRVVPKVMQQVEVKERVTKDSKAEKLLNNL